MEERIKLLRKDEIKVAAKMLGMDWNEARKRTLEALTAHIQHIRSQMYLGTSTDPVGVELERMKNSERERYIVRIKRYRGYIADDSTSKKGFKRDSLARAQQCPCGDIISFQGGLAICPWHDDTTPSLKWYRNSNRVVCFSCHASGDAIDLYMKVQEVEFPEAVVALGK